MNNSSSGIKKVSIRVFALMIGGLCYFLFKLDIDIDTVISTIAVLLFVCVIGYFLLPKTQGRRHSSVNPKHKQYDDSRLTDTMMKKIMEVYNVKEETDDKVEKVSNEEIGGKIKEIKEEISEEVDEEIEGETNEEIQETVEHKQYNDSLLTDYMMEKILKAYNVKEEADDIEDDDEEEDSDEEFENTTIPDENRIEKVESQIAIYGEEENTGLKALLSPTQLPVTLAGLWFIIAIVIYNFFPAISQSIPKPISPLIFTALPILFLIGLSGVLGILFKQPSENLETTPKENTVYILNIFKALIGWGAGIYIFITNF